MAALSIESTTIELSWNSVKNRTPFRGRRLLVFTVHSWLVRTRKERLEWQGEEPQAVFPATMLANIYKKQEEARIFFARSERRAKKRHAACYVILLKDLRGKIIKL